MNPTPDHYGITVSDIDTALDFYRDELGFEESFTGSFKAGTEDGRTFSEYVEVSEMTVKFAFLEANGLAVELLEFEDTDGQVRGSANSVGTTHICFEVDDIDECLDSFERNVETTGEQVEFNDGTRGVYLFDPDGNFVELVEYQS